MSGNPTRSGYYHTSMQDIFVGGLCVIGFLLATDMAGEFYTVNFWASLIAGVAVLGAWAFAGGGIWQLTRLYIGEVVSAWAFAISWLVAGFRLTVPNRPPPSTPPGSLVTTDAALTGK